MIATRRRLQTGASQTTRPLPRQLIAGVALLAVAWPFAWFGPERIAEHTFFPLWLAYILIVGGLTERRTGTSLLTRSPRGFALLFLWSAPLWWLFEAFNQRLGNWEYLLPSPIGATEYALRATISFSTVVPALFVTAELYRSTSLPRRFRTGPWVALDERRLAAVAAGGAAMLALVLAFPDQAYPLVWLGLFFLIDPLVALAGGRSLVVRAAAGQWETVAILSLAGLTCGFFWEMWNYWSMPKWIYHIPYVGRPKLFEMPVLGYGGYLPFALEVNAAVQLLRLLTGWLPSELARWDDNDS